VHLADGPRGGFQSVVRLVRCEFLFAFRSIRRVGDFGLQGVWQTVHEESADSPYMANGPRVGYGRSVFGSVLLVVREAFSNSSL
jgi:hypothetical protein